MNTPIQKNNAYLIPQNWMDWWDKIGFNILSLQCSEESLLPVYLSFWWTWSSLSKNTNDNAEIGKHQTVYLRLRIYGCWIKVRIKTDDEENENINLCSAAKKCLHPSECSIFMHKNDSKPHTNPGSRQREPNQPNETWILYFCIHVIKKMNHL